MLCRDTAAENVKAPAGKATCKDAGLSEVDSGRNLDPLPEQAGHIPLHGAALKLGPGRLGPPGIPTPFIPSCLPTAARRNCITMDGVTGRHTDLQ